MLPLKMVGFAGELSNLFMNDLKAIVNILEESGLFENDKLITSACRL